MTGLLLVVSQLAITIITILAFILEALYALLPMELDTSIGGPQILLT